MPVPVKIDDLTDAFDQCGDEQSAYVDRETGQTIVVDHEVTRAVEDGRTDGLEEEWSAKYVAVVTAIVDDPKGVRFAPLPGRFEFHEYHQMERFIRTVEDAVVAEELGRAIKGRGAFRCFKDTAARHGRLDDWYRYRDEAQRQHLLDWAAAHAIPVDLTPGRSEPVGW